MSDCISRQAVENFIYKGLSSGEYGNDCVKVLTEVHYMPSVTPTERTGHWERVSIDKYVQHAMAFYRCSECGKDIIGEHNYCPSCGARMVEPQESEDEG